MSPTYRSWLAMKQRCMNPNSTIYHRYGGRGIAVCDRWINSFEAFLEDMGKRPKGKTIDRWPDNEGNYEPGNCRWATRKEQRENQQPTKKYRGSPGSCNGRAKLTPAQVLQIRKLKGKYSTRELGRRFNVSHRNISYIWTGGTWRDDLKI